MTAHPAGAGRGSSLRLMWARLREGTAAQLWPVPAAGIGLAVIVGILLPRFDAAVDNHLPDPVLRLLFDGGADSARAVLSAIAGSLITATSLTFSLTVVALQLASTQASPRLLRLFAQDRMVHATLAVFLGTFAFALTVLRIIKGQSPTADAAVPRITITLASVLTLASIIMLVLFLAHLARELRVETMLRDVHGETLRTLELLAALPDNGVTDVGAMGRPEAVHLALAASSGFITSVDRERLTGAAADHDIVVEELHAIGDSVIAGVPLARWWPRNPGDVDDDRRRRVESDLNAAYSSGYERTSAQDLGFGLRQLVDIAVKALSPGVNDPTTAVHALSHISDVVRRVAQLPVEPSGLVDGDGIVRLIVRKTDFDALLELAVEQPRRYGASDPVVAARLFALLQEVGYTSTTDHQRGAVRAQNRRLAASVAAGGYDDVELARFERLAETVDEALRGRWR